MQASNVGGVAGAGSRSTRTSRRSESDSEDADPDFQTSAQIDGFSNNGGGARRSPRRAVSFDTSSSSSSSFFGAKMKAKGDSGAEASKSMPSSLGQRSRRGGGRRFVAANTVPATNWRTAAGGGYGGWTSSSGDDDEDDEEEKEFLTRSARARSKTAKREKAMAAAAAAEAGPAQPLREMPLVWVNCNSCSKWRSLPRCRDPATLPDTWVCADHPTRSKRYCHLPQEVVVEPPPGPFNDLHHDCLLVVFGYLLPRELCRAARVSTAWRSAARQPQLWTHLNLVDFWRCDWNVAAAAMRRLALESADLRAVWIPATIDGMSAISLDAVSSSSLYESLVQDHGDHAVAAGIAVSAAASPPSSPAAEAVPPTSMLSPSRRSVDVSGAGGAAGSAALPASRPLLAELVVLSTIKTLRHLQLPTLPSAVFKTLVAGLPSLITLTVESIVPSDGDVNGIDFSKLGDLAELKKLQIRGRSRGGLTLSPFTFGGGINNLGLLKHLAVLEITGLRGANAEDFGFLASLHGLQALCLGDCELWDEGVDHALSTLATLTHLRLEGGGGAQSQLGAAIQKLSKLVRLDLMLYHLPAGLAKTIGCLQSLETLCLQPFDFSSEEGFEDHAGVVTANENAFAVACAASQASEVRWGMLGRDASCRCAFQASTRTDTVLAMESQSTLQARLKRGLPNALAVEVHFFNSPELSSANFMEAVHTYSARAGVNSA